MDYDLTTIVDPATLPQGSAFERYRAEILAIEARISQVDQIECPIRHYFSKGCYVREMTIPAGAMLTGMIHLTEHINIISKGDISVLTEEGPVRIQAPFTFVSKPGTKRVGVAHSETVWSCIHVTDETDLAKIQAEVVTNDFGDPRLAVSHWHQEELSWLGDL